MAKSNYREHKISLCQISNSNKRRKEPVTLLVLSTVLLCITVCVVCVVGLEEYWGGGLVFVRRDSGFCSVVQTGQTVSTRQLLLVF